MGKTIELEIYQKWIGHQVMTSWSSFHLIARGKSGCEHPVLERRGELCEFPVAASGCRDRASWLAHITVDNQAVHCVECLEYDVATTSILIGQTATCLKLNLHLQKKKKCVVLLTTYLFA